MHIHIYQVEIPFSLPLDSYLRYNIKSAGELAEW